MTLISISPTQSDVLTALRSFLLAVLPNGVDAIVGIQNRVAEPSSPNFVMMTPIRFQRLGTNFDAYQDVKFTASIAPATAVFTASIVPSDRRGRMAVSTVSAGTIFEGMTLSTSGLPAGATVGAQIDGTPGGIGTYDFSAPVKVASQQITASCGVMTVTDVRHGEILDGAALFGVGVASGSKVVSFGTGSGGLGTYAVQPSQALGAQTVSAGYMPMTITSQATVQLDFHALDGLALDMAQTVSTTFRDDYATRIFDAMPAPMNKVSPFYADDPQFMPFSNENQQMEWRWVLQAMAEVDQTVAVPMEFADSAIVGLIEVDSRFPP